VQNTAETIKLPFAFRTWVGPMNHVLHEVHMPTREGKILRGNRQTIVNSTDTPPAVPQSSVQRRLNRLRCRFGSWVVWVESFDSAGFSVPLNTLGHFGDGFFGSNDPTNSVKALKEVVVLRRGFSPTRSTSPCCKPTHAYNTQ